MKVQWREGPPQQSGSFWLVFRGHENIPVGEPNWHDDDTDYYWTVNNVDYDESDITHHALLELPEPPVSVKPGWYLCFYNERWQPLEFYVGGCVRDASGACVAVCHNYISIVGPRLHDFDQWLREDKQ